MAFGHPMLHSFFPQQRKLMGSSAHNSSGVRWCRRRVRFNKVPEKVPGGFGAEPGQVQQGSVEHSGEGSNNPWCKAKSSSTGSVGGSGRRSGRLWCRVRSGSTRFRRRFWRRSGEALVQSQVRFNRVPEEGSSEGSRERSGSLWCRVFRRRLQRRFPCKAKSGSTANFSGTESASELQPEMHYSICAMSSAQLHKLMCTCT